MWGRRACAVTVKHEMLRLVTMQARPLYILKMGRARCPPEFDCCACQRAAPLVTTASPGGHSGPGMGKIQRVQDGSAANSSMDPVSREDLLPVDLLRIVLAMDLSHERQIGLGRMDQEGMKGSRETLSPILTHRATPEHVEG